MSSQFNVEVDGLFLQGYPGIYLSIQRSQVSGFIGDAGLRTV